MITIRLPASAMQPTCPKHGPMAPQPTPPSPEARWCGSWWECPDPWCRTRYLASSPALRAALAAQEPNRA